MRKLLIIVSLIVCSAAPSIFSKERARSGPPSAVLVADLSTNKILHAHNHHKKIYPASLTKLMTLYILFDELQSSNISFDSKFKVSEKASNMPPCKIGLQPGEYITVRDVALALIVKSANDVALVCAENISGDESKFAALMNRTAKSLGMRNSYFVNASGWHNSNQYSTAADLLILTKALKTHFPEYYSMFKKTQFVHKGKTIRGHNRVTQNYHGAEGLKTGYTSHSGFNIITTAYRNNKRIAGIVIGEPTAKVRDAKVTHLLNSCFGDEGKIKNDSKTAPFKTTIAKTKSSTQSKTTVAKAKSSAPSKTILAKAKSTAPSKTILANAKSPLKFANAKQKKTSRSQLASKKLSTKKPKTANKKIASENFQSRNIA
jgi:D-alanyl-D-alanine carboxypeptidase (penicillin-binding protein 5/6)